METIYQVYVDLKKCTANVIAFEKMPNGLQGFGVKSLEEGKDGFHKTGIVMLHEVGVVKYGNSPEDQSEWLIAWCPEKDLLSIKAKIIEKALLKIEENRVIAEKQIYSLATLKENLLRPKPKWGKKWM